MNLSVAPATVVDGSRSEPSTADTVALLTRSPKRPAPHSTNANLVRELAVASFKLKYAGSALGYLWSLMRPLMIFGILYLVFAVVLLRGRTVAGGNFPVELLVGIVVWTYFAEATSASLSAVVTNADLVLKTQFPRWILVVAATASATMTLLVNFSLMLVIGLWFHWFDVGWQSLLVLPLVLEMATLALGLGLLLSACFVRYRDLGYIWEVLLLLLFYGSAVIFPFSLIPPQLTTVMTLNPIAQMVEDLRRALVSPSIPWSTTVLGPWAEVPVIAVCLCLLVGVVVFGRMSRGFGSRL